MSFETGLIILFLAIGIGVAVGTIVHLFLTCPEGWEDDNTGFHEGKKT